MAQTRIYVIINKQTGEKRLVEASTGAQAVRHCVSQVFESKVAGTKEIAGLMRDGYTVETASGKAEAGDTQAEEAQAREA